MLGSCSPEFLCIDVDTQNSYKNDGSPETSSNNLVCWKCFFFLYSSTGTSTRHPVADFIMPFQWSRKKHLGYKYLKKELEEVMELLTPWTVMDAGNGGRVEVLAQQQWGRWWWLSIGLLCGDHSWSITNIISTGWGVPPLLQLLLFHCYDRCQSYS